LACLVPDPDPMAQVNRDVIRVRIRNTGLNSLPLSFCLDFIFVNFNMHASHITHASSSNSILLSGICCLLCSGNQCCGSIKFWCGPGSADPYLCLMDPDSDADPDVDPDSAIFVSDLQKSTKN
jgi:hypothetical protein